MARRPYCELHGWIGEVGDQTSADRQGEAHWSKYHQPVVDWAAAAPKVLTDEQRELLHRIVAMPAGEVLDGVATEPTTPAPAKRRGRPRKHVSEGAV
jgi:hypothetical protein